MEVQEELCSKAAGHGSSYPRSENPDLHPTDEDLSVGTPELEHSFILAGQNWARG
jgi:hypothetical protein